MYARYIPPPKGPMPRSEPQPEPESPSPAVSSATPYARYVPPVRPQPRAAATPQLEATRYAPTSKTHLNAAAIPPPEAVPAKIVFNYDDDEPAPAKKRKLDSPDPNPESREGKSKKSAEEDEVKEKRKRKSKSKSKDKDKTETTSTAEGQEDEDADGDVDHKAEKRERRKKKKLEEQPFTFGFNEDAATAELATGEDAATPTRLGTKRKDKKKKAKSEGEPRTEEEDALSTSAKLEDQDSKARKKNKDKDDVATRHKAVLEKAARSLQKAPESNAEEKAATSEESREGEGEDEKVIEVHGLEPLPQPEPVAQDTTKPTYETLPAWITNPIRVTPETKASLNDLGISKEAATKLESKGYQHAFAVQTAVIPLLLPSHDRQGDVVVSAATGSGKTLAYALPMVRDISQGVITRLRGLIIVPTRELVMQAKEVCEACAGAFSGPNTKTVKVGISIGNKQFEQEQADLVEEEQRYDPIGHQKWLQDRFDPDSYLDDFFDESPKPLPGHVIDYVSKVDILICTPGRLVDHINRTRGFTLDYVRWLVVDEADKLLAQSFQDWLPVVMPLLSTTEKPGARDFPDSNKNGVRKVVLSATMTRDLSLLNGLKLSRPKLVTLEAARAAEGEQARESKTEHVLPELLEESAIKIRDPDLKPLYLVDLLNSKHMSPAKSAEDDVEMKDAEADDTSSDESASESDPSVSDNSTEASSSDSEPDSASRMGASPSLTLTKEPFRTTVLIFTKSNETAIRLSRLLSLLSPGLTPLIGTLTSTTRTSQRRKTLRAFSSRKLRILVASDLVARGIDLTNLDHVVNYDMPTSVASYVHRVGRTARAGRSGSAWTLYTKTEAGWFWNAIAGKGESRSQGAGEIRRRSKVEDVRIDDRWEEGKVEEFESALERLGKEATEMRRKR